MRTSLAEKIIEFREYFDKNLKPKKPSMKNLDREVLVEFLRKVDRDAQEEIFFKIEMAALAFRAKGFTDYADSLVTLVNELRK